MAKQIECKHEQRYPVAYFTSDPDHCWLIVTCAHCSHTAVEAGEYANVEEE